MFMGVVCVFVLILLPYVSSVVNHRACLYWCKIIKRNIFRKKFLAKRPRLDRKSKSNPEKTEESLRFPRHLPVWLLRRFRQNQLRAGHRESGRIYNVFPCRSVCWQSTCQRSDCSFHLVRCHIPDHHFVNCRIVPSISAVVMYVSFCVMCSVNDRMFCGQDAPLKFKENPCHDFITPS